MVSGHRGGSTALALGDDSPFFGQTPAVSRERERFGRMIGQSEAMKAVFETLSRVANSDATVLLEGETGTGKEISAEALHRTSRRRDKPFLVVDCGAIPPQLLESELF
ncbi:MAG TPA: sigma 54-interacting transcriptional regulator, partial [Polyangia bacterium]